MVKLDATELGITHDTQMPRGRPDVAITEPDGMQTRSVQKPTGIGLLDQSSLNRSFVGSLEEHRLPLTVSRSTDVDLRSQLSSSKRSRHRDESKTSCQHNT